MNHTSLHSLLAADEKELAQCYATVVLAHPSCAEVFPDRLKGLLWILLRGSCHVRLVRGRKDVRRQACSRAVSLSCSHSARGHSLGPSPGRCVHGGILFTVFTVLTSNAQRTINQPCELGAAVGQEVEQA